MSEITFDQIKAFQDQLDQHPASGALGRAVQNVGPQAANHGRRRYEAGFLN